MPSSIPELLLPTLLTDPKAVALLKAHHIEPLRYVAYKVDSQRRKEQAVGKMLTAVFTVGLFALGYVAAGQNMIDSTEAKMGWGIAFGLFGFGIGWGSMKHLEGKRIKYFENPEEQTDQFTLIGILNTFKPAYLKTISEQKWQAIATFYYDPRDPHYQFRTGKLSEEKKQELTKMTPAKEAIAKKISLVQRICVWLILIGIFAIFGKGLFFIFLAWTFASIWIFLEGLKGFITRNIEAYSEMETIKVYGWPARFYAITVMLVGALFALAGVLGVAAEMGYRLIDIAF